MNGLSMPVRNITAATKIERDENGILWVSNRPVGMRFKRACGTVVPWSEKGEVCLCEKCLSK